MKKLIIIAAAFLCGIAAQASTVAWGITGVKGPDGNTLEAGSVYLFFVEGSTKADTSAWAGLAGKGLEAFTEALADATYSYSATETGGTFSKTKMELADVGVTPATKYSVYAVIVDSTTVTKDSNFFVTTATAASTTYTDASALQKTYSLTATGSADASNWHAVAVPEPTSGLLMLVGLAGLALRRRRA